MHAECNHGTVNKHSHAVSWIAAYDHKAKQTGAQNKKTMNELNKEWKLGEEQIYEARYHS